MKIPVISSMMEKGILTDLQERIQNPDSQRKLVLVIVCVALLLDNMLYMVIVPIIPIYLEKLNEDSEAAQAYDPSIASNLPQLDTTPFMDLPKPTVKTVARKKGRVRRRTTPIPSNMSLYNDTFAGFSAQDAIVGKTIPILVKYTGNKHSDAGVGALFASKAIVQLFVGPISGTVIDRIGYETPMIIGLSIIFISTSIFAFGRSYGVLFAARSLQGVGSAFADTAGLAMIADRYKIDSERSKAQGIALAFISFGCLFAPPFGGFFYTYAGKEVPFLVLSLIALIDGIMLKFVMKPAHKEMKALGEKQEVKNGTPIYRLIMDPYIALCAGALVMANVSLAFLEPTIALWMKETMNVDEFQIGAVWLPAFVPHVLGVYVTVKLAKLHPTKQWLITAIGLVIEGLSCLIIPFCTNFGMVIIPLMIECFGIALVDTAILPTLGYLVDHRHVSVYGSVYAIADISYSLAYAFGPIVADKIYQSIGFTWLNVGICLSNILYAPLLIVLKNVYKYKEIGFEEDEGFNSEDEKSHLKKSNADQLPMTERNPLPSIDKKPMNDHYQYNTYAKSPVPGSAPSTQNIVMPQANGSSSQQQSGGASMRRTSQSGDQSKNPFKKPETKNPFASDGSTNVPR